MRVFSTIVCLSIILFILVYSDRIAEWGNAPVDAVNDIANVQGCTIQNNRCEFALEQQKFDVTFLTTPIPEEEITVQIKSENDFDIDAAWIEGINMYMGKSPVIVNKQSGNSVEGIIFLGSCNLQQMEWQIVIVFKQKTHPIKVRFTTSTQ